MRGKQGKRQSAGEGSRQWARSHRAHCSEDTRRQLAPCCSSKDFRPQAPQRAPLPGTTEGPRTAGSAPAGSRRRLPRAQPRADPSGRRGSAAGLSGPGENKGARRRGRGKEAPPAEERGGSAPRGRGEPSLRPSPASRPARRGRGRCLAPASLPPPRRSRAHTDAAPLPGPACSVRQGTRAGGHPGHSTRPFPKSRQGG